MGQIIQNVLPIVSFMVF